MGYWILFLKALHIIGFTSWFAALFYLPRLFVYYTEALEQPEVERWILTKQFLILQKRLAHIIMTPAMVITFIAGFGMVFLYGWEWFSASAWLHWKLLLLAGLVAYHFYNLKIIKDFENGKESLTSTQFRMYNEIATLFLVAIVMLAVFKGSLNFFYAFFGLIGFTILLGMGIKLYKRIRERAEGK
ncbi:MAG: CopD family protein [Saprospiraceae bacterium]|nr:CopD family protein [Saprospiraceae bacterium]